MSSLFRAPRSGGKLLRGRSRTPPASPYARPPEMSPPPAVQTRGSPRWLAGLILGAGKLISSVLPSKRSVSSSSGEDEEEESSSDFDEEEEHCELNQGRRESDLANKNMTGPLAIVPQNESKLLIEKLLMQETFSRDECDRLTKLIQSRVLDFPSPEVCGEETTELQNRTPGNDIPLSTSPVGQKRSYTERVSYSSSKPNLYSPNLSALEVCTPLPHIYNKAIAEAKKWLEERKLVSKPIYDEECGPCMLNTDMLNHEIEDIGGSPVDMAKSYMRSLPPWRSSSFSGVGVITPPKMLHYNDGIFHETTNNSVSWSKGIKRDHVVSGSLDSLDETRRVRFRSAVTAEISKSKQIYTCAGGSDYESPNYLLNADKKGLYAENHCSNIAFRLPDKEDNANHPSKPVDIKSSNDVSEPENVGCAATVENSISEAHPPEPIKCLDENLTSQIMEEADEVLVPNDTLASASKIVESNGIPSSETEVPPEKKIESVVPSDVDADLSDVPTSEKQISTGVGEAILAEDTLQLNPVSRVAVTNCKFDSRLEEENSLVAKNANGSLNETSIDGPLAEAEVNVDSNYGTLSGDTDKMVPQNGNGTRMNDIERMSREPQRTTNRRGRKMAVKSRRGRKS